ncbi:MAG: TIR domain-containing protein, partial [Pseudomonadota bacterium]
MADVFISYARALPGPKLTLESKLWREGYTTWSDAELNAGETFEQVIIANVDNSNAVITIWTPPALKSRWVPYESKRALEHGKLFCTHTNDVDPGSDLSPDFYGEQSVPVDDFPNVLNALVNRGIRPDGRSEADLPDSQRIQREATREWLEGMEASDDLPALRGFLARYERAPTIRQMVKRRIALLEARARAHDKLAADMLERALVRSDPRSFRNFLDEFDADEVDLARVAAERFAELDPDGFLEFTAERRPGLYAVPRQGAEHAIRLRDTPPEAAILRLDPAMHTAIIRRISLTADGAVMASASEDKTVKLWALPEGRLIRTLRRPIGEGDEGKVLAVTIDPAGRWVAVGGWDLGYVSEAEGACFVTIFDTDTGAVRARLGPLLNVVLDLEVSPDGARLAAGLGGMNGIRIWEAAGWRQVAEDTTYGGEVYGLAFAADGRLASTSWDGHVRLYGADGKIIQKARAPGGDQPFGIAFCPEGTRLAVGYDDSLAVDVLDAASLNHLYPADTSGLSGGDLSKIAWLGGADAGLRLAAGGRHQTSGEYPVFIWDEAGRGARHAWPGPANTIMDLTPMQDDGPGSEPGAGLALASSEPSLALYGEDGTRRLNKPPEIADLRGKLGEHFTVSGDGQRLRFGLDYGGETPALFDLAALRLTDAPEALPGLTAPDTTSLNITGWVNTYEPALTRDTGTDEEDTTKPLALESYEKARSLAIAPGAESFILGTEWALRCFDATGSELWQRPVPGTVWGVNLAREGRLLLAAYADGTIRWHRASDGAELLALFIHLPDGPKDTAPENRDWILWTPEGY